ncbi:hypothetical protein EP7_002043 [Isosphaeraceae bacterium EP7]
MARTTNATSTATASTKPIPRPALPANPYSVAIGEHAHVRSGAGPHPVMPGSDRHALLRDHPLPA